MPFPILAPTDKSQDLVLHYGVLTPPKKNGEIKNQIFYVTFHVVFQKYVAKTVNFCLNRLFPCIAGHRCIKMHLKPKRDNKS